MPTAIRRTLQSLENNNFNPNDAGNTAPSTIPSQPGGQVQNTQNPNTPSTGSVQPPQSFDGNIPAQSFGYQSPNVNTTTPTAPPAGALQSRLDTALEERTTAAQGQEQQQGALEQRIRQLSDATLGRGEVIKQRSQEAGIDKATGELNDLLGLVSQKTSAYEKGQIQDQIDFSALEGTGQGIPQSLVRGRQARLQTQQQLRRQSDAVELNSLNRTAELMQGRITTAQQNIKDDVELEFGDKERALNQEMKFLERIDTKLASSKAEKLQFEIQQVQQERQDREQALTMAVDLAKNGAPQSMVMAANSAKSVLDLLKIPGASGYLRSQEEKLRTALLGEQLSKARYDNQEVRSKISKAMKGEYVPTGKEKYTEGAYALRMDNAKRIMDDLIEKGVAPKDITAFSFNKTFGKPTPGKSDEQRQFEQASLDFLSANLRKESGAAIAPLEIKQEFYKYIPLGGDSAALAANKAQSQEASLLGMMNVSEGGYESLKQQQTNLQLRGSDTLDEETAPTVSNDELVGISSTKTNPVAVLGGY